MKKKYYFILLGIILVTATFYILLGKGGMDPRVVVEAYDKEWGIVIPNPTEEKAVFASEANDDGHGQWLTVYSYEEQADFSNSNMELVTEEKRVFYNKKIQKFEQDTFSAYSKKAQKDMELAFEDHHLKVKKGDYAFYKKKEDGQSYFIAIYSNKELYTYNWHE
ncbi:hypothetical protein [Kurthia sibirica]|uniref:Uncharacterized protein n=1 Tax=Kurthia sibirica TaxID=202750 RepID=A0A2U3AKM0_9BACL|nr:hypothetical protein [Kurthia sibirica]PWI25073.1 hypothetical protein DEX24_10020 [Kurthia sibirica]GEK34239.1 hypothetical protein KSI01_17720 [Kurthia sibirica]